MANSHIQAIYFIGWSSAKSRAWLKKHSIKPIKRAHRKGTELRYRLLDPTQYKRFTTRKLNDNVYLVLGYF